MKVRVYSDPEKYLEIETALEPTLPNGNDAWFYIRSKDSGQVYQFSKHAVFCVVVLKEDDADN